MIVTKKKPIEEVLKALRPASKIFIIGCGDCAATRKTGGEKEIAQMKADLEANGKSVTGWVMPDSPCVASQMKLHFAKNKKAVDDAKAFLVLSCGLGCQSTFENDPSRPSASRGGQEKEACLHRLRHHVRGYAGRDRLRAF